MQKRTEVFVVSVRTQQAEPFTAKSGNFCAAGAGRSAASGSCNPKAEPQTELVHTEKGYSLSKGYYPTGIRDICPGELYKGQQYYRFPQPNSNEYIKGLLGELPPAWRGGTSSTLIKPAPCFAVLPSASC